MRIEPLKLSSVHSNPVGEAVSPTASGEKNFGQFLTAALDNVNSLQQSSEKASVDLAAGKIQDVSQVVIATEKATIALQLTMQVRNKIVDAYQEVMRMQV